MIFVPIGYTFGVGMFEMEKVKGGSPYGVGTCAGDGSRQPTELDSLIKHKMYLDKINVLVKHLTRLVLRVSLSGKRKNQLHWLILTSGCKHRCRRRCKHKCNSLG